MSRKPQTDHAQAIAAFQRGLITRDEFKDCCRGVSIVDGSQFWDGTENPLGWTVFSLYRPRTPEHQRDIDMTSPD